uniref:Uncharacterized protein n=1 Tax=Salix viminalis TaxID=40686 RepID=A0A6N2NFK7_SALVM
MYTSNSKFRTQPTSPNVLFYYKITH